MRYIKQTRFGQTFLVIAICDEFTLEVSKREIKLDQDTDGESQEYSWYFLNYNGMSDCDWMDFQTFYTKVQIELSEAILEINDSKDQEVEPADKICKAGYCCNPVTDKDFCSERCATNWILN